MYWGYLVSEGGGVLELGGSEQTTKEQVQQAEGCMQDILQIEVLPGSSRFRGFRHSGLGFGAV